MFAAMVKNIAGRSVTTVTKQKLSLRKGSILSTKIVLLASMAALFVSFSVHAQVIFSNFSENSADADYPYHGDTNGDVYGFDVSWAQGTTSTGTRWAMPFSNNTGADQHLGTVSLAMYKNPDGAPANLTIRLIKDDGHGVPSSAPGDILETLTVDPVIAEDGDTFLNLNSVSNPLLLAGTTYWVTAETSRYDTNSPAQDVLYYWIQNNSGSKFSYTISQFAPYSGWLRYYNQPDPPNRFPAPTLRVVAVLPPTLSISLQGSNAVIQWPTNNANGFRLETQTTLQPNSWAPVIDTPQPNGEFWKVTQPLDSAARFYRLISP